MTVLQYSNPKSAEKANNVIAYSLTPTKNLLVETNLVLSYVRLRSFCLGTDFAVPQKFARRHYHYYHYLCVLFVISTMTYLSSLILDNSAFR